ncbi:hypothetical protein OPU71_01575 [Niveibacterium sp. 24ML]|uniref:hypothetical protein n=1 Tax=Niveibacterium sp. 24ML TaxID=2985512 RepID=UPI00226F6593|nr:hypothetical protein [Niveibacterium sp. 24ML]MCX9154809.1 hypothetical protein [Niveibacterium sp. 24ML]
MYANARFNNTPDLKSIRNTPPKLRLNEWWIDLNAGPSATTGIIGTSICTRAGRTSAVIDIDAETRRVKTKSGTVYELGLPESAFAQNNKRLLRELGLI